MTSTLTLYYKSLINKDKNFILDNPSNGNSTIENYLSTLEKQVITGFQYVKQGLSVVIKLNKTQDELMMGHNARDLNYIKIQNGSETPCYYFIINKNWKSENTIELVLNMDTLNTFQFNKDYELNKKTLVKREHRDRFERFPQITFDWEFNNAISQNPNKVFYTDVNLSQASEVSVLSYSIIYEDNPGQTYIDSIEPYTQDGIKGLLCTNTTISYNRVVLRVTYQIKALKRKIDMKSEEISTPVYKKSEKQLIEEEGRGEVNWSLYYKNSSTQEDAPVDCLLVPDTAVQVQYINQDGIIDADNASSNYMIFCHKYSGDLSFNIDGKTYAVNSSKGADWGFRLIAVIKNGANIDVYSAKLELDYIFLMLIPLYNGKWEKIFSGSSITLLTPISSVKYFSRSTLPTSREWFVNTYYLPVNAQSTLTFGTEVAGVALSKNDIDRTDPTNIKIIDLPYSPNSFKVDDSGTYILASLWKYDSGLENLRLVDYASPFKNDVKSNGLSIMKDFIVDVNTQNIQNHTRFLKDSKLYHSDYYRPKFVYDSFTKIFPLEHIVYDPQTENHFSFNFTFVMTRNIVSKFLFMFDYTWKDATEDYPNVLAVARNNEEVLYNSSYINYLKMGYNYDVKAKERQETASAIGIGLNVAGIIGSVILAVATENPLPIAGAVAGGFGLVGQTINHAKTTAQNEENIQRKLQETQMQSISVMNADDIDLLNAYSSNKAKLCYYEPSEMMKEILDDLFYYGGYVTNVQKIPNVKSRYWFNYVQASLVLEETNNLTEEIENDIKEKFENGVTFLHLRNGTFDLKQEKENIETSIVGG